MKYGTPRRSQSVFNMTDQEIVDLAVRFVKKYGDELYGGFKIFDGETDLSGDAAYFDKHTGKYSFEQE
jgi:hypothetical protein